MHGQLGDGTAGDHPALAATSVTNAAGPLASGLGHSCVLIERGKIRCWGANAVGQLGNNTTTDSLHQWSSKLDMSPKRKLGSDRADLEM